MARPNQEVTAALLHADVRTWLLKVRVSPLETWTKRTPISGARPTDEEILVRWRVETAEGRTEAAGWERW